MRDVRRIVAASILLTLASAASAQERRVDFRFAPATHLTAICLPMDWQKTVVTERGALAYDFGPGPYTRPLTEISVSAKEIPLSPEEPVIADPRAPIVRLRMKGDGASATLDEFAVIERGEVPPANSFPGGHVTRVGGLNGTPGWADPPAGTDPAFCGVAWGTNRPILYRVHVTPGATKRIALGFCESYKSTKGQRVLELRVEGAPVITIDALRDGKNNVPYVYFFDAHDTDGDGEINVEVHASQKGIDPNVILNAFWVFPEGTSISEEEVIRGDGSRRAEIAWPCGLEMPLGSKTTRVDAIVARFDGRPVTPQVVVRTGRTLAFDTKGGTLGTGNRPFVTARPPFTSAVREGNTWKLDLPAGTREAHVYVLNGGDEAASAAHLPEIPAALADARKYWLRESGLPFGTITVPDSGIQYVLDAGIRDMYQIAEYVDGRFQFQPGPSVYRGLWMHDEAWDVVTALSLGDIGAAMRSIETALTYQQPDGRIAQSEPFPMLRETALMLYAACRFGRSTDGTGTRWLEKHAGAISSAAGWIRRERALTLGDHSSPAYGLFPRGFTDGGIGGMTSEYGTTFWSLNALRAAARAAQMLNMPDSAKSWNALADELMHSFRMAAARDARRDDHGNIYLPMKVGDTSAIPIPQQANWGMLDAQAFGHLFPYSDTLLNGTLAMLDSRMAEGIHQDVGWLRGGVWPFLTAQEAIVHVYQRSYAKAEDDLYAVANHASSMGTWLEEQLPKSLGTRTSGDASDATAGSLFVLLLRELIANERADTLELLGGVPAQWYGHGARLRLDGAITEFGPLTLDVRVSGAGDTCFVSTGRVDGPQPCTLRIVLGPIAEAGFARADGSPLPASLTFPGAAGAEFTFIRKQ